MSFGVTLELAHQFGVSKGSSLGGRRVKSQHRNRPTANDLLARRTPENTQKKLTRRLWA